MKREDFKVDDEVWCLVYGKGVVVEIIEKDQERYYDTSVIVKFEEIEYTISYGIDGKIDVDCNRTLFVVKRNVKEKDIKELYFKLLDEVEEVKFEFNNYNYYLFFYITENNNFHIQRYCNSLSKHFNNKYISKEDADTIVKKMRDFIGNK